MHCFSIAVGVIALVTGLIAAYWWYQSAQIVPVPSWAVSGAGEAGVFGGVEPGDSQLSDSGWIAGLLVALKNQPWAVAANPYPCPPIGLRVLASLPVAPGQVVYTDPDCWRSARD
jgi:hypothetical protein